MATVNELKIESTPLGWAVELMYLFSHCATILCEDIDMQIQLKFPGDGFIPKKKKQLKEYENDIKNARVWLRKSEEVMRDFDLEGATYDAANRHNKMYSNVIASANELIRASMLVIDRGHCDRGQERVFKRLRSLPEQGIFPMEYIERFQMKYEIIPESGDRIHNDNHGDGTLDFHTGSGNWNVKFDNGDEVILNERQFVLL